MDDDPSDLVSPERAREPARPSYAPGGRVQRLYRGGSPSIPCAKPYFARSRASECLRSCIMFASSHMPNQTLITCVSVEIWTKPVSAETARCTMLGEYRPSEDAVFATRSTQAWRCAACRAGAAPCPLRRRNGLSKGLAVSWTVCGARGSY